MVNSLLQGSCSCCENCTKLQVRDKSTSLVFFCAARNHIPAVYCSSLKLNDLTKLILGMVSSTGPDWKRFVSKQHCFLLYKIESFQSYSSSLYLIKPYIENSIEIRNLSWNFYSKIRLKFEEKKKRGRLPIMCLNSAYNYIYFFPRIL